MVSKSDLLVKPEDLPHKPGFTVSGKPSAAMFKGEPPYGQCEAESKTNPGHRCKNSKARGADGKIVSNVCKRHGADAGRPVTSGVSYTGKGLASEDLLTALENFTTDPELESLTAEIAVLRNIVDDMIATGEFSSVSKSGTKNFDAVVKVVDSIRKLVETQKKMEVLQKGNISITQLDSALRQMANNVIEKCGTCENVRRVLESMGEIQIKA